MKKVLQIVIITLLLAGTAYSQDFKIFGFGQAYYSTILSQDETLSKIGVSLTKYSTYSLQQFNLMGTGGLGKNLTYFFNLEYINNYNTTYGFGAASLSEAMVRYQNDDGSFNVKFGTFLPKFNSYLEVYNRMPLLSSVYRPTIYEPALYSFFNAEDFLPLRANLQISGYVPLNENISIEYAVFHGNPEFTYILGNAQKRGTNTSYKMTYGGRLGFNLDFIKIGSAKIGISVTSDQDNQQSATLGGVLAAAPVNLGDVDRTRIGGDFNYTLSNLSLTAEFITVSEKLNSDQQNTFDTKIKPLGLVSDLNKSFYMLLGEYTIYDDYTLFFLYSRLEDHILPIAASGIKQFGYGVKWAVTPRLSIKTQISGFKLIEPNPFKVSLNSQMFFVAASVMF